MSSNILLDDLQKSGKIKILTNPQEFQEMLNLEKAIVYLYVGWSGQEIASRKIVYTILNELETDGVSVFQIDLDTAMNTFGEWLVEQHKRRPEDIYGGYGETILVSKGNVIDFVKYPPQLGPDKMKEKIIEWKTSR
ncbi:MAG: hypothetical protein V4615_15680 [Bacteroidota bacterium]